MIDRILKSHLEPIARDHRRWELFRILIRGWGAAALLGLVFILIRFQTGWSSPLLLLLLAAGAVVWACLAWWQSRRGEPDYKSLVRRIEEENPELHALLLTAVEQTPDPTTGQLNYLQDRIVREALAQDASQGWHSRTLRRLDTAQICCGLTFMFLAAVMIGFYVSLPTGTGLFTAFTAPGVTVTPGDASVEKGSSLVVLARFEGSVPAAASLIVRPANQPERRIQLAKNLDDPVFGTSVPEVNGDLTYRIEYGNETTRDFRVTVFEYPRLERADAKVAFPEYTGIGEKSVQDTRRVSAVEGSTLDYTFHLNKPVVSAVLKAKDDSQISLLADTSRPNVYTTSFKLATSRRYELLLVDDAGRTNKLPPQFVLDVLTNRTPELKFVFPRGDQQVSPLEEIAFQGEAMDDFGLKAYGIAYNLAGQDTKVVELGQSAGAHEKRTFDYLVAMESLGARQDQLLSYYLWADDIGPDGNLRRTVGDMFFAEVRPFEEIFREGQSPAGGQQQQGQQRQGAAERLAELQKQIINATWNLQRRETRAKPSSDYKKDATVIHDSQENALEQVKARREEADDSRAKALIKGVQDEMETAAKQLGDAVEDNSLQPLPSALSAEQSAYQALLRLAAHEFQIVQNRNGQGGQSGRGARAQRQLDMLEMKQSRNRYETQSQAAPPQSAEEREQLQVFSRLKELAQRQQDVNERLKELQTALQEAKTEVEREELQRRLKRLQEEQQQLLADVDEVRQRMERPENQSRMADARQQLDQSRSNVQRASEALEQGQVSQALSSGTRAQRDLQQLRDDFRKQSSSQFAEDMREMRSQARDLAQKQEDIGGKLDALNDPKQPKTLTDSEERTELASQLDEQKQRLDDLVKHASEVTERAESVEPLLSRQLYDTLRKASQDDTQNLQDTTDDLLSQGRMYRSVYDQLREAKNESKKPVEVAADLLRQGFSAEANNLERRARRSINDLKDGVEHAAESVLGDDTEALRFARQELDTLSKELDQEITRAQQQANTNSAAGVAAATGQRGKEETDSSTQQAQPGENGSSEQARQGRPGQQGNQGQQTGGSTESGQRGQQDGQGQQAGNSPGNGQEGQQLASNGQQGQGGNRQNGSNQPGDGNREGQQAGGGAGGNFFDQFGGTAAGGIWGGPITGPEYMQWSDRLRNVEELLDVPELRTEAARIRDRARGVRIDLKRHSKAPQWDMVRTEISGPLLELRDRISEELARRESKEALVPIDRDPVPTRYSELVRRYYEELGKSE
jgi:hypothetical protein